MRIIHTATIAGLAIRAQHQSPGGILMGNRYSAINGAARPTCQTDRYQRRLSKTTRSTLTIHINECSLLLRHQIKSICIDTAAQHQGAFNGNASCQFIAVNAFQRIISFQRGGNTTAAGLDIHTAHRAAGADTTVILQQNDTISCRKKARDIRIHRQHTTLHPDTCQFCPCRIHDILHTRHTGSGQQVLIIMNIAATNSTAITSQHQSTGSRFVGYYRAGIHRSTAINNLHPFNSILGKATGTVLSIHIQTGGLYNIQITLGCNRTADAQRAAIADGLLQSQFHPGINNKTADAAGNQLTHAKSIGVRQCQAATIQHHAASVAVIATQGHRSKRHHAGASAQRSCNLASLRHQHAATHGAAKLHITSQRHRARRCRKRIGRRIHQQGAAGHLNTAQQAVLWHILQYLAYRYGMTSRHYVFCEIRSSTSRSKTILAQHQGQPRGQVAVHQLCSAAQHLATLHHLQAIPFSTGKAAFPGVAVHIDLRGIQLRQLPDAAHIHLTAQRQGAIHRIGDDLVQLQRSSLHHDAAHPRRGQHTRKILRFDFQTGIIQAHHSAAQRRGRARYHLAAQNLRTSRVIIFGVDSQRSRPLLGLAHIARQLAAFGCISFPSVVLGAVHQHARGSNIAHQRHRAGPLIAKHHLHTIDISIILLILFPVQRGAIPHAILCFVRPCGNQQRGRRGAATSTRTGCSVVIQVESIIFPI